MRISDWSSDVCSSDLPTKLHTKLYVIDDAVHVGSANFDVRSLFLNLELMLRIEDPAFAAHVRAYVDHEIADSERITKMWWKRHVGLWQRIKQATELGRAHV